MTNYYEQLAARKAWQAQWPNHCTVCEGAGSISYEDDPSSAGVSLGAGTITGTDPCPGCAEWFCCARCNQELPEVGVCTHCGWNPEEPDTRAY